MNVIIYNRVSSEDQNPENQLKDCQTLAQRLGFKDWNVMQETASAFKDNVKRPVFESILEGIRKGGIKTLIIWDFDRLYRNRAQTIEFIRNYGKLGLKVYSYRQQWIEQLNQMPEPWNLIVSDFLLNVVAWMAEDESRKKSERVRAAIRKEENGETVSYRGKKWGRPRLTETVVSRVLELREQGLSIRNIAKQVEYWDKNRNNHSLSVGAVHKIVKQFPVQLLS